MLQHQLPGVLSAAGAHMGNNLSGVDDGQQGKGGTAAAASS